MVKISVIPQIFLVYQIVKSLETSSWSSCTTLIAKVEESSNECKFFNLELLSYLLYLKYLGYLTTSQVLIYMDDIWSLDC